MKKALIILFCLAGMVGLHAQTAAPIKTTEVLTLTEGLHDFGNIQQGRPVTYEFAIVNKSKTDTLKLEDVHASCGCTTPVWKKEPVAPGASSVITVGYNAYAEGPFEKTVTIAYNGGQNKVLQIKGTVYKAPASPAPVNSSIELLKQSN
jgi:Protein of unknown function (DUF1573)